MVIEDTGSVEGIYAFIYCTKWRSEQVLTMPYGLTALKDRATQLLIKYKSGALVTQFIIRERENADQAGSIMMMAMMVLVELMILKMMKRKKLLGDFPNEKKLTRPWFLLPSLCCSN